MISYAYKFHESLLRIFYCVSTRRASLEIEYVGKAIKTGGLSADPHSGVEGAVSVAGAATSSVSQFELLPGAGEENRVLAD